MYKRIIIRLYHTFVDVFAVCALRYFTVSAEIGNPSQLLLLWSRLLPLSVQHLDPHTTGRRSNEKTMAINTSWCHPCDIPPGPVKPRCVAPSQRDFTDDDYGVRRHEYTPPLPFPSL